MTKMKKGDFIELDFIGRIKSSNEIFDLTSEEEAKKNNLYSENYKYGSVIICIGQGQILKYIDDFLIDKEIDNYTIEVSHKDAFGVKNSKLIRIIPLNNFTKQKINPFPGLQVNLDNYAGTVRSVTGGRVIVDFNHPLAGKDLSYELKIKRIVNDLKEKVTSLIKYLIEEFNVEIIENKAKITLKNDLPKEVKDSLEKKLKECIPEIKEVEFTIEEMKKDTVE